MANVHTRNKSGFVTRGGVRRRETLWIGSACVLQTIATPGAAFLILSLSAGALALRPFTIVRTRGVLYARSDQTAATEQFGIAVGSMVASDEAVAIGVTAVPNPASNPSSDLWYLHELMFGDVSVATVVGFQSIGKERIIDSKAMRKVEEGQDAVTVLETCVESNLEGCDVMYFDRTLVKLH